MPRKVLTAAEKPPASAGITLLEHRLKGAEVKIYWDCWNGENDDIPYNGDYTYTIFMIKGKFTGTTYSEHDAETKTQKKENVVTGINKQTVDGEHYVKTEIKQVDPDGNTITKLPEKYQTYQAIFSIKEAGEYEFAIWSKLPNNDKYYGPTYYPERVDSSTGSSNKDDQVVVIDDTIQRTSLLNSLDIYKLIPLNAESPNVGNIGASKEIGSPGNIAIVKNESSPRFSFQARINSTHQSSLEESNFNFRKRITIREVSSSQNPNQPNPNIYLELTGTNLSQNTFVFPESLNSIETAQAVAGKDYNVIPGSGVVLTKHIKEDKIPIRHFDVVVEAYDVLNGKTSAGNVVFDNTVNEKNEGDFSPNPNGGFAGYDIVEVKMAKPKSFFFLNEYSERDGFVSPKTGYDRNIPYIIEPSITDKGNVSLVFSTSRDEENKKTYKAEQEISSMFDSIRGIVLYYADESFSLNPEQINLENGDTQKISLSNEPFKGSFVTVKRRVVLRKEMTIQNSSITFPFAPFKDKQLTQSNISIGSFDQLTMNKHFIGSKSKPVPRIVRTTKGTPVASIFGEKDLSFSQVAPSISEYDGELHYTSGLPSFNENQLTTSSIPIFKKSPTDEGAKALSYRSYCYLLIKTDNTIKVIKTSGIVDVTCTAKSRSSSAYKDSVIAVFFKEKRKYIPVVTPYEEDLARSNKYLFKREAPFGDPYDTFEITVDGGSKGIRNDSTLFLGFLA